MKRSKVLLVEINEITWNLLDPLIQQGKLPVFDRLKAEGAWAAPVSVDLPPQLDPWITWTTLYTGQPQANHNVFFLEQPPETIHAQRLWEYCHDQGLSVGVYGSLCSWPPQQVRGYYVPDTFAPAADTWPESLRPIQQLNLAYTRANRLHGEEDRFWYKAKLGSQLLPLGLRPKTVARITRQLTLERRKPELRWQRVALQPFVNFDFFSRLYQQYQPDFATFHTNHVAHYQHTYWKAMQPELFPQETSPDEVRQYGGAIEYGYRMADKLLGQVLRLLPSDTVLVVASSMGQKPFLTTLKKGKRIRQIKSLDRLLDLLGLSGRVRALATMSDQFNLYADTPELGEQVNRALSAAYLDSPEQPMFSVDQIEASVTGTLLNYDQTSDDSLCHFPLRENPVSIRYTDLVQDTGLIKSGCHDPKGMMIMYGKGIKPGSQIEACNNLDIAPTILTLLGLPVPEAMKGRVLSEAFQNPESALGRNIQARQTAS